MMIAIRLTIACIIANHRNKRAARMKKLAERYQSMHMIADNHARESQAKVADYVNKICAEKCN